MINTYQSITKTIEAVQFSGDNYDEVLSFVNTSEDRRGIINEDGSLGIVTLEGAMIARPGYYVIKGIKGEVYPCAEDVFVKSYRIEQKHTGIVEPLETNDYGVGTGRN